jgi:hypothetical protein
MGVAGDGQKLPVEWVRLDPNSESLAAVRVLQPESMLAAQLERCKDVVAQSAAVAGLAAVQPATYGVVNALRACVLNSNTYCRCAGTKIASDQQTCLTYKE